MASIQRELNLNFVQHIAETLNIRSTWVWLQSLVRLNLWKWTFWNLFQGLIRNPKHWCAYRPPHVANKGHACCYSNIYKRWDHIRQYLGNFVRNFDLSSDREPTTDREQTTLQLLLSVWSSSIWRWPLFTEKPTIKYNPSTELYWHSSDTTSLSTGPNVTKWNNCLCTGILPNYIRQQARLIEIGNVLSTFEPDHIIFSECDNGWHNTPTATTLPTVSSSTNYVWKTWGGPWPALDIERAPRKSVYNLHAVYNRTRKSKYYSAA